MKIRCAGGVRLRTAIPCSQANPVMTTDQPPDQPFRRRKRTDASPVERPAESLPAAELEGFLQRLAFALGPVGTGLLLDFLDLATFGPVGLLIGAGIGGYAGWVLAKYEGFDRHLRFAFALCTAAYMMIPFTEWIPAATILLLLARFLQGPAREAGSAADSSRGWR